MTSYLEDETYLIEVSTIIVPEGRQRSTMDDEKLNELAESIRAVGQIHPIVITRDNKLVVGERRLKALKILGHHFALCRYVDTRASVRETKALEYIENLRREDLSWRDTVKACYEYHNLMKSYDEEWTNLMTAGALSLHPSTVGDYLRVYQAELDGHPQVTGAQTLSSAQSALKRDFDRAVDAELEAFDDDEDEALFSEERHPKMEVRPASRDIQQVDFLSFQRGTGPRYNLIHCDFPYGISHNKGGTQTGTQHHGSYDDDPEVYWKLIKHLVESDIVASSAHILFWFSMHHYEKTKGIFESAGYVVSPFPLIWHKSDNTGLLPDPNRGPRRIYETALFITRGDRKIVRPVNNLISIPANKDKALHISEKPLAVVSYFLQMLVDPSTMLLDPTCGSGSAVLAGEMLGAVRSTGFEINEEHVINAQRRLNIYRRGRADKGTGSPEPVEGGSGGSPSDLEGMEISDLDLDSL